MPQSPDHSRETAASCLAPSAAPHASPPPAAPHASPPPAAAFATPRTSRLMPAAFATPRTSLLLTAAVFGLLLALLAPAGATLAQIPDSGAQRNDMLREQRLTNQLLAEAVGLLKQIRDAELRGAAPPAADPRSPAADVHSPTANVRPPASPPNRP